MKYLVRKITAAALATMFATPAAVLAQQGDGTDVTVQNHVFKPAKVDATAERIAALVKPEGFAVTVFARGLKNPRILAVAPNGDVYVSRREQGDVLLLKSADGKTAAAPITVANRPGAHGLAIHDGELYIATVKDVFVAAIKPDGTLGPLTRIIDDLPDAGQHEDRTLAFGPDGMLYLSTGSTCNACNEPNPENATLQRASVDGKSRSIWASGLRNTIGFDWNPSTGELWGLDNGIDFLGDHDQSEELNRIERGKQYGWPHVWGDGGFNPQSTPVGGISKEQWKAMSTPQVLGYAAHAAPMQLVFYTANAFPQEYSGDAFATMRGSWNAKPATGYEIVRIHFEQGRPLTITPFVSGFLTDGGTTHFARPVGLAVAHDGALLMAEDGNGMIYRIAYTGSQGGHAASTHAPATAAETQAAQGTGVALALSRLPPKDAAAKPTLTSPNFAAGAVIPARNSSYAEGISVPLQWSGVPGARSYALIVEDPDAKPAPPVIHWVIWNIPATTLSFPEGLQQGPRLTLLDGALQGLSTHGAAGYYGPHPPIGDAPHHYHFQLFALDTMLDIAPGSTRDQLITAANGHVIAATELIGTFAQAGAPAK